MRFSVKKITFPSLEGDFFATFDHTLELTRILIDCRTYLLSVFTTLCVFPKLSFGQRETHAFIADLGLRKVVLRAETRFAIIN